MNKLRLVRHFAAALSATAVASTQAAVIHWSDANLVIPATYAGMYINIEERTTGSGEDLAGWDMNPYGANGLLWYQPVGGGVLRIEDTAGPSNLALGALVGAGASGADGLGGGSIDLAALGLGEGGGIGGRGAGAGAWGFGDSVGA